MKHPFIASFEGPDLRAITRLVLDWPAFSGTPRRFLTGGMPASIEPEHDGQRLPDDWKRQLVDAGDGFATLSRHGAPKRQECRIGVAAGTVVTVLAPDMFSSADDVLRLVEPLPFTTAAFGSVFPDTWRDIQDDTFGFANSHTSLGWGCAFKGSGHDRLVSRRWLDFGPWRVRRGADDLALVQFHDLALTDPAVALAQASPGHERMGISEIGGFIQGPSAAGRGIKYTVRETLPEGLYDAKTRTLEVVVPAGREISQGEMLDACAYRLNKRADKSTPIERVAYVFIDEANARAHLHELWLRELEVWTVDGGEKRRLDLDHHPAATPPEWVRNLEARP